MSKEIKGRGSQFNLPNRFEKIYIDQSNEDFQDNEYFEFEESELPGLGFSLTISSMASCRSSSEHSSL